MMKFKKFLAAAMTGVMMFGVVATAAPVVSAYAEEVKASTFKVEIDYKNFTATIYTNDEDCDKYVVLEVHKSETSTKASNTYVYNVDGVDYTEEELEELGYDESDENAEYPPDRYGVRVDLSFLKASKDSWIRVRGSSEAENVYTQEKINKQQSKLSVKYVAGKVNAYEAYTFKDGNPSKDTDLLAYEYRTLYGSYYASLLELDRATAEVAGTTIVVRRAAVGKEAAADKRGSVSAEVKVKIPAAPKAPKVTVDYVKQAIKLPKSAEVQVMFTSGGWKLEKDTYVEVSGSWVPVTDSTIEDYFEYKVTTDGDGNETGAVDAKVAGTKVASDAEGSDAGTTYSSYVSYTKPTIAQTKWTSAGTASDQKSILDLFKNDTGAPITDSDSIKKQGFTLAVRTEKTEKKAASNPQILQIKKVETLDQKEGEDKVTLGTSSLSWKSAEKGKKEGVEFTVTGDFEYKDGEKWKALKNGAFMEAPTTGKILEVRAKGVKADKNDPTKAAFPSESKPITIKAAGKEKEKAEKPTVDGLTVKIGDAAVAVFARDGGTKSTINVTVTSGKGALIEYSTDNGTTWKSFTEPTTVITGMAETEVKIKVRAVETETNAPSEAVEVTIAA